MKTPTGWVRPTKPTVYTYLKPTPPPPLVKCYEPWQLPTVGRVIWMHIKFLKGIKGLSMKNFIKLGERGEVPRAYYSIEHNRYEWDGAKLRSYCDWFNAQGYGKPRPPRTRKSRKHRA